METTASRTSKEFEPSRPWVIGAVLLCAVGTLGAVANSARPRGDVGRAAGFADVLRINPGVVSYGQAVVVAVVTAAGVRLVHIGAPGAGAVLIGAGVGAQVFGASTDVWIAHIAIVPPRGFPLDFAEAVQVLLHLVLLATAIGGALLAPALHHRYDGRPELAGPSGAEPQMGARTASAVAAATLVFVPVAHLDTVKGGFSVTACWLLLAVGLAAAVAFAVLERRRARPRSS
ncbi:hypothetical protein [Actinomadura sp. 3N407]|uniref:hypothetical protein n=1 Tax=Actinomadura sp. 3N407 TaxID=3457423 RepID=UPI003FCEA7B2